MGMCRECKHGRPLTLDDEKQSLVAQKQIHDVTFSPRSVDEKAKAIEKIVMADENKTLQPAHGGLSLSMKPMDADGQYIACSNKEQLAAEKATKGEIVHKYYFQCPFFKAAE